MPERYVLTLEPKADEVPAIVRLRALLKHAIRAFRLRCVAIHPEDVPGFYCEFGSHI